jgi:hypothetical protein
MTVAPLTATVLASADQHRAGLASGVNNAIARVSGLVSISLVGVLISAQYAHTLDQRLAGQKLSPQAAAAVSEIKTKPLAPVPLAGLPVPERPIVAAAASDASTHSFHFGIAIAGGLVAGGGLLAGVGIRNPARVVKARRCPAGQFASAPEDAVCPASAAAPTGPTRS